jgi:putative transcriptional regulator
MARLVRARLEADGSVSIKHDRVWKRAPSQTDWARIDATTEEKITAQLAEDDAEAARDSAGWARRVRRRTGFSQVEFARRLGVTTTTVRDWERQGVPHGPVGALFRLIDRAPEVAMAVLAA